MAAAKTQLVIVRLSVDTWDWLVNLDEIARAIIPLSVRGYRSAVAVQHWRT
ncbi:hypothetical protein [Chitiniphilus eburneus]|uniref:hypothetical protein n=1 Tax=Chitiniphilus eburneus TaxID=2571148 RepID=UPI00145E7220|nr:hypothetical protein [Chitiniphilus eburneus]